MRSIVARGLLILVMLIASTAHSAPASDDGGSGTDAGDTRLTALQLPDYGAYAGKISPDDVDWYAIDRSSSMPRCAQLDFYGANNDTIGLTNVRFNGEQTVRATVPAETMRRLAIAGSTHSQMLFDVGAAPNDPVEGDPARPGNYSFTLRAMGPSTAGLGESALGVDAGSTPKGAIEVRDGCVGGSLSTLTGLLDTVDTYRVSLKQGEEVIYSLAVGSAAVALQLVDAAGAAVGPAIRADQTAFVSVPYDGEFYLTTSYSTTSVSSADYVIGLVFGPPGSQCRPTCMAS